MSDKLIEMSDKLIEMSSKIKKDIDPHEVEDLTFKN